MGTWIGFAISIVLLLVLSRRNLALGMFVAAVVLAAFSLSGRQIVSALASTAADPSVWLLAWVVALIPMIGGVLEESGQMDRLVSNLRIGVRPFLAFAPALLGMLPMPGGALLSAPLVERGAGHVPADIKASANVWFRHALLLVYPLGSALIASSKAADLSVYDVIPFLAPSCIVIILLGVVFLLRRIDATPRMLSSESGIEPQDRPAFSWRGLLVPLMLILIAPILDLLLAVTCSFPYSEIGTAIGISASLVISASVGRTGWATLVSIFRRMRPWKYALIILAMFSFLAVFQNSGIPERIADMSLHPVLLCVVVGFLLGVVTGRIQAPMAILIPIYVSTYGSMGLTAFAVTYSAVFLGYIITPVHPCISVSVEYFHTSVGAFLRRVAAPVAIGWALCIVAGWFLL
ncbi:DUF401 family protein [Candidatus Bipolaricaulota bacterium]|nr:DUF401 family protein [Candidatus Bipolaricaulota bacterium]